MADKKKNFEKKIQNLREELANFEENKRERKKELVDYLKKEDWESAFSCFISLMTAEAQKQVAARILDELEGRK